MPTTTKKPHVRPAPRLDRVRASLDGMGRDLRVGGRDLYGDLEAFVRSIHRDVFKLGKALRTDVAELARATPTPEPVSRPEPRIKQPAARRTAKRAARRMTPAEL